MELITVMKKYSESTLGKFSVSNYRHQPEGKGSKHVCSAARLGPESAAAQCPPRCEPGLGFTSGAACFFGIFFLQSQTL